MIAYPNSGNISLFLLRVKTAADALGNQSMRLVYDKSKYIYVPSEETIYKVERTYQNGTWMELYCSETQIKKEEIEEWNL